MGIINLLSGTKVLENTTSQYNGEIQVIWDLTWGTYIQVGGLTQSGGILFEVWQSTLRELQKTKTEARKILILGLGGGSVAKLVSKKWPQAEITGVDIDEEMINLGKKYLGLDASKIKIVIQDAYEFKEKDKFDLILVDLYCGDKFPEKFEDEKFLIGLKKMLKKGPPGGEASIAVFNRLYGGNNRPDSMRFGKRLEKVFKKVDYMYPQANVEMICYN